MRNKIVFVVMVKEEDSDSWFEKSNHSVLDDAIRQMQWNNEPITQIVKRVLDPEENLLSEEVVPLGG